MRRSIKPWGTVGRVAENRPQAGEMDFESEAGDGPHQATDSPLMGPVAPRRGLGLAAIADDHAACAFHLQFHGRFTGILGFVGTVTVGFICRFATGTIILGSGRFIDIVGAFLIGHGISLSPFGI